MVAPKIDRTNDLRWWDDPLAPFESFDLDASFASDKGAIFRSTDGAPNWAIEGGSHVSPQVSKLASIAYRASQNIFSHVVVQGGGRARLSELVNFGLEQIEEVRASLLQEMASVPARFRFMIENSEKTLTDEEAILRVEEADASEVFLLSVELGKTHRSEPSEEYDGWVAVCGYSVCLREIDYALRALTWDSGDTTLHTVAAIDCFHIASQVSEADKSRERVLSEWGRNARKKALRNDPKQADKLLVKQCWDAWRRAPESYTSKAAFARDMLEKCSKLTSSKVIEDWCRLWEKSEVNP